MKHSVGDIKIFKTDGLNEIHNIPDSINYKMMLELRVGLGNFQRIV